MYNKVRVTRFNLCVINTYISSLEQSPKTFPEGQCISHTPSGLGVIVRVAAIAHFSKEISASFIPMYWQFLWENVTQ